MVTFVVGSLCWGSQSTPCQLHSVPAGPSQPTLCFHLLAAGRLKKRDERSAFGLRAPGES